MSEWKAFLATLCILLFLVSLGPSCGARYEYSDALTEKAVVDSLIFVPEKKTRKKAPSFGLDGRITMKTKTVHIPARYEVVLHCEKHGRHDIQGKTFYGRFTQGQAVTVSYRVVYVVTEEDGELRKRAVDLDFLDAQ